MAPRAAIVARWVLVLAAIAVLLGHICAVPVDAEAVPLFHHHGADTGHEHERGGETVHAGCCEMAAASSAPWSSAGPSWSALPRPEVPAPRRERAAALPVAPHATSPPLFLVHAALLI
jgi:hypothetical protein